MSYPINFRGFIRRVSLAIALFSVAGLSQADTSVYKVTKNGRSLYLGGTIHVLSQSDFPLPKEFDQAFEQSTHLVFETDMGQMALPQTQQKMMLASAQPAGATLQKQISKTTYNALKQYCAQHQLPLMMIDNMKAGAASMVMMVIALQKMGLTSDGVDQYFYDKAIKTGKKTIALESVDEQLSFIGRMGEGIEDQLIAQTLSDLDQLPVMMKRLKAAWRKGNREKLKTFGLDPMKKEVPKVYDLLLKQRNGRWLPQIEAMMASKPIEYVLVGALHLVGKDGLISQLEAKGYKVEPVVLRSDFIPSSRLQSDVTHSK